MGQMLFYPPNVKGWDGGADWLNSDTMLTRENFARVVRELARRDGVLVARHACR